MKTYYEKSLRFKELKTSKVQTASKAGGVGYGGDFAGTVLFYSVYRKWNWERSHTNSRRL